MKTAIVVDMRLTGVDVPSLATMYVYKPTSNHNPTQAIARANLVCKDKEGGLVMDYADIAGALKEAMNDYTVRDLKNYGDMDMNIAKTALPKFEEKLSVCWELFHRFNYSAFLLAESSDKARANLIAGGINFCMGQDKNIRHLYQKEAFTANKKTLPKPAKL